MKNNTIYDLIQNISIDPSSDTILDILMISTALNEKLQELENRIWRLEEEGDSGHVYPDPFE